MKPATKTELIKYTIAWGAGTLLLAYGAVVTDLLFRWLTQ